LVGYHGGHPFWHCMTSSTLKIKKKVLIGGQTTMHDLPFLHKNSRDEQLHFYPTQKYSFAFINQKMVAMSFKG